MNSSPIFFFSFLSLFTLFLAIFLLIPLTLPPLKSQSSVQGWGLFTEEDIISGEIVSEYVGQVITREELEKRREAIMSRPHSKDRKMYFMEVEQNMIIDASKKGALSRFLNHSCEPNCVVQKWTVGKVFRVGIFALRDIEVGEELTIDYKFKTKSPTDRLTCFCGAPSCTGVIGGQKTVEKKKGEKKKKKKKSKRFETADECFFCE